jgi:hypothetical protein
MRAKGSKMNVVGLAETLLLRDLLSYLALGNMILLVFVGFGLNSGVYVATKNLATDWRSEWGKGVRYRNRGRLEPLTRIHHCFLSEGLG